MLNASPVLVLAFFGLCCHLQLCTAGWSAYTCVGQPAWEVTVEDNAAATKTIQNWFAFRQNRCVNDSSVPLWRKTQQNGGLGSLLTAGITNFLKATELGHIFAPEAGYVWGFSNASLCSRHIKALDCFTLPLTYCDFGHPLKQYPAEVDVDKAFAFHYGPSDICIVTKKLRKTILWTMGQGFMYLTRLPPHLHKEWSDEYRHTMKLLRSARPKHHKNNTCVTASIHVRTGHLDFGRRALDGSEHLTHLNAMNAELLKQNKEICGVFVATSAPNETVFASATLGKLSPMYGYDVLLMPRFVGNISMEMEQQIGYYTLDPTFRPDRLYVEYMLDLKMFGEAEIYIGSHSNMFMMAAGYRSALHPEYPNEHSCFLDSRYPGIPKACFGSMGVLQFLRDTVQGFNGGAVYFH